MNEDYIHVVGRPEAYDRLKQGIKRFSPRWFIRLVQVLLRPYVKCCGMLNSRRCIRRGLPPALRGPFRTMYRVARARWDQGLYASTGEPVALPIPGSSHSVWVRPGTCDVILYYAVFLQHYYGKLPTKEAKVIIDCGSNVGFTSAYFLCRYPESRVVAIEPDSVNFELCRKNLQPFQDRVTLLKVAVWGKAQRLVVQEKAAGTWASSVRQAAADAGSVDGVDIPTLLHQLNINRVDILKIDIEGAEREVFTASDMSWLDRVNAIQIETDNRECEALFINALRGRPFSLSRYREILIANRQDDAR